MTTDDHAGEELDQDGVNDLLQKMLGPDLYAGMLRVGRNKLAAHKFSMTQGVSLVGGSQWDRDLLEVLESDYRAMGGDPDTVAPDHVMAHDGVQWETVPVPDAHYDPASSQWVTNTQRH